MRMMEQIESLGKGIAHEFHPDRIILFGSYAYGRPNEDSDVDLLVILPFIGKPVCKAIEIRPPVVAFAQQVPPEFLDSPLNEKGRVLYDANHP